MATTATAQYYDKQAQLAKDNADIAYQTALADLVRKYGVANRQLEANLESRGILRSGEGNLYRTELTAEEQGARASAEAAKQAAYNQADLTLAGQLAALQAGSGSSSGGSSSGGTPAPSVPAATPAKPAPSPAFQTPTYASTGLYGTVTPDLSKVDFNALGRLMEANKPKPAVNPAKQTASFATTGLYGVTRPVRDARGRR